MMQRLETSGHQFVVGFPLSSFCGETSFYFLKTEKKCIISSKINNISEVNSGYYITVYIRTEPG